MSDEAQISVSEGSLTPVRAGAARPRGCRLVTTSVSARLLLVNQLRALDGIDWTVVSGDAWPDPPGGIGSIQVPMRRELAAADPVSFGRLLRLFRARRFAFVQTHTPKASLLGLPAARLAGTTAVYTMHGSLYFRGNRRGRNTAAWFFERWCCAWASRVLLQSAEDMDSLPKAHICPKAKLRYIGNGIELGRFALTPPPRRAEGDLPVVVMVARLVAEKGCRDFFRLARILHGQARFVHVGPAEADQRDALSAEECRAAAASGVELVGEVDDVRPFVASADLVVLPSYREGIPRAATEAAAMGRPVVAYDIRGVREVIPPATGLLVPLGDVDALAHRVAALLDDPEQRARLGRACSAHAARFSEADVVVRVREVYTEMGIL